MLFGPLKKPLTTMAESVGENLSQSSDDSSASYVLSIDSITSDSSEEGKSNKETPSASLSQGKRKPKRSGSSALGLEPVQRKVKMQCLMVKKLKRWSLLSENLP